GLALWLGGTIDAWLADELLPARSRLRRWAPVGLASLVAAAVVGWGVHVTVLQEHEEGSVYRRLASEIRRRTDWPVIFFRAEPHEVAFHVGRPLDTILEWETPAVWATQPEPVYIVMPPDCAAVWPRQLPRGRLHEVLRTSDLTSQPLPRPLVVLCSVPPV